MKNHQFLKGIILYMGLFAPLFVAAQSINNSDGIEWTNGLTWNQIVASAKKSHKLIFVDCFATWCGPCKQMDQLVYSNKIVGDSLNKKIIAVRLQMDTSKKDDDNTKMLYSTAHQFSMQYDVSAYPTFLFFDSDGQPLHKDVGFKDAEKFLKLIAAAADENKQYYTLKTQFKKGTIKKEKLLTLINQFKILNERQSLKLAVDSYKNKYLNSLDKTNFLTGDNIKFIYDFNPILSSGDNIFKLIVHSTTEIDSIVKQRGFARGLIINVANREVAQPLMKLAKTRNSQPDWNALSIALKKNYDESISEELVLTQKINYYKNKDQAKYCAYLADLIDKYKLPQLPQEPMTAVYLNNYAWDIFNQCNDTVVLNKALKWVDIGIGYIDKKDDQLALLDTKANLMYKLGKPKNEVLHLQEQALEIVLGWEKRDGKVKGTYSKEFLEHFEKMKAGKPTWNNVK